MPRRSKLTPKVRKLILEHVAAGQTNKAAFTLANISETTFYRWLEDGEPPGPDEPETEAEEKRRQPYREFREALTRAEADFMAVHVQGVRDAAMKPSETRHEHVVKKMEAKRDAKGNVVYGPDGEPEMIVVARTEEVRRTINPPVWNAHLALIERKDPENWGRRVIQHDGRLDMPPPIAAISFVDPPNLPDDEPPPAPTEDDTPAAEA